MSNPIPEDSDTVCAVCGKLILEHREQCRVMKCSVCKEPISGVHTIFGSELLGILNQQTLRFYRVEVTEVIENQDRATMKMLICLKCVGVVLPLVEVKDDGAIN